LLNLVDLYQQYYPQSPGEIQDKLDAIDFAFLSDDFMKLLNSMQEGATRIRDIVLSLRNFSRLDESERKPVDIHEGIDNTLLILQPRLKPAGNQSAITVIKEYGKLPFVDCYAGQLNQVFMNILSNAIDAVKMNIYEPLLNYNKTIRISTEIGEKSTIYIRIADNGVGIPEKLKKKIFDPFFTTKPVGSGTGLGLSISFQIIEKHGGSIEFSSEEGRGTEFVITLPVSGEIK
jgi:two-component system NtrC family sensor kinase